MKNKKYNYLIILLVAILILSSILAIKTILRENNEKASQDNLLAQKQELENTYLEQNVSEEINEISDKEATLIANQKLAEQNSDFTGWLKIENTTINYPVMYTPDDYDYYLRKNFNQEYALSGELFIGLDCSIEEPKFNTIIYGHNMHNHTMFSDLTLYAEETYYQQHQFIQFDTLNENRTYQIFAVFQEQLSQTDTFKYYTYLDYNPIFVNKVDELKLYDTGITIDENDQILTLSTCDNYATEGRFVVLAKLIQE